MPLLDIQSVSKSFTAPDGSSNPVIHKASLQLDAGAALVISGPSGCGKSTLLNVIAGIQEADDGSIFIGDQDIQALGESERDAFRGRHIGYIFQSHNLMQGFSAADNVRLGGFFSGRQISDEQIKLVLEQVGLGACADYMPAQLSLGQQQRIGIARALIHQPQLILADEPSSSLDGEQARACIDLLLSLASEQQCSVLIVSHDERVFDRVGARIPFADINGVLESAADATAETQASSAEPAP